MKALNYSLRITGIILSLILILSSCSSTKKTAVSCPELPGYYKNQKIASRQIRNSKKLLSNSLAGGKGQNSFGRRSKIHHTDHKSSYVVKNELNKGTNSVSGTPSGDFGEIRKAQFSDNLIASVDNSIIPFVNSSSDGNSEKEMKDDNAGKSLISGFNRPLRSNSKSDTRFFGNSDERENHVSVSEVKGVQQFIPPKIHGLALAGMILGIIGLFVAGIPLGLLATIFGAVALSKIKLYPDRFSGRGLAIASIILGIAAIVGAIIVLAVL